MVKLWGEKSGFTQQELEENLIETDRLIELAKSHEVDLGNNPRRRLIFWRQMGLLPRPIVKKQAANRGTKSYYNLIALSYLETIRNARNMGISLSKLQQEAQWATFPNHNYSPTSKVKTSLSKIEREIAELEEENKRLKAENEELRQLMVERIKDKVIPKRTTEAR